MSASPTDSDLLRSKEMSSDRASNEIKKSMAYDLLQLVEENTTKEVYTSEELKRLIKFNIITETAK